MTKTRTSVSGEKKTICASGRFAAMRGQPGRSKVFASSCFLSWKSKEKIFVAPGMPEEEVMTSFCDVLLYSM